MDGDRTATLHRVVAAVQRRWGARALQFLGRAPTREAPPVIPTGLADLDSALGIGGLPRGRMTELLGSRPRG